MGLFNLFKKKQRLVFDDGAIIEYKTTPPNFRGKGLPNEIGMIETCGSCKFHGDITSIRPQCTKYGVQFEGFGCLDKTVCDDFENVLFDLL